MEVLNLTGKIDDKGHLNLHLPTSFPPGNIEIVLIMNPIERKQEEKKYDFSDLAGKLNWKGDAVAVQRELRDE